MRALADPPFLLCFCCFNYLCRHALGAIILLCKHCSQFATLHSLCEKFRTPQAQVILARGQVRYFTFHFHDANNATYVSQQSELFLLESLRDKEGQCSIISRTSKNQACHRNPTTGPCNRFCHSWSGFETFDDNTICYCKDTTPKHYLHHSQQRWLSFSK